MSATPDLYIPQRRRAPKDHLRAAALSPLGSDEERYSVQAAQAEALARIEEHLAFVAAELTLIVEHLKT